MSSPTVETKVWSCSGYYVIAVMAALIATFFIGVITANDSVKVAFVPIIPLGIFIGVKPLE